VIELFQVDFANYIFCANVFFNFLHKKIFLRSQCLNKALLQITFSRKKGTQTM